MGKHSPPKKARTLLIVGVTLLILGLVLLAVIPLGAEDVEPPPGQVAGGDTAATFTAVTGLISALAGLITSIVGLVTAMNARKTKRSSS